MCQIDFDNVLKNKKMLSVYQKTIDIGKKLIGAKLILVGKSISVSMGQPPKPPEPKVVFPSFENQLEIMPKIAP